MDCCISLCFSILSDLYIKETGKVYIRNGATIQSTNNDNNPVLFIDGELKKGYGGGHCQVSTTIYNAVNKIDGVNITERHEHEKEVGYIKMGRDSTVVYDNLDLKFENNTGYDIKLYTELSDNKVKVKVNRSK